MGELRERRRVALPLAAGLGGMVVPVLIFLAINAGRRSAHGWGAAMSTDTAFALGHARARRAAVPRTAARVHAHGVGRRRRRRAGRDRDRLHRRRVACVAAPGRPSARSAALLRSARLGVPVRALVRRARGGALGRAPQVGRRPDRDRPRDRAPDLRVTAAQRSTSSARPTSSGCSASSRRPSSPARRASGCRPPISPNERLQQLFHPWTSYVIVPLFALANAGIVVDGELPLPRVHLADHAGHPGRLRRRQARRVARASPGS